MIFLLGTTADGVVGGLLLRTDKMEESVSDHEVERKALEEWVKPLADVPMGSHHFVRIRNVLEKADPICVVLGISLPPLEKGKYLHYPQPNKDGAVESSHHKKKPRVRREGMVLEWLAKKNVIPHALESPGYKDHFNDVARYLSKLCNLPGMRCVLVCFQNENKSTQESKEMGKKFIADGKKEAGTDAKSAVKILMKYVLEETGQRTK